MTKPKTTFPKDGQVRTVIENISPGLERYEIKSIEGHMVAVEADILIDGHDLPGIRLHYRHESEDASHEIIMEPIGNNRYRADFQTERVGYYYYQIEAYVDHFATWQHEVTEKIRAGFKLEVELLVGAEFFERISKVAEIEDQRILQEVINVFKDSTSYNSAIKFCFSQELSHWIKKYPLKDNQSQSVFFKVFTDRRKANFSAWYSMFPRSASQTPGLHGTFNDVQLLLPRIKELGFDVLYIPPVHPIGKTFRKGKNNAVVAGEGEPGVPYGIGFEEGGHIAIHSELGTVEDFKTLVTACKDYDIELAMDLAIQCSPDHPWVKYHPNWFKILPDGTIKYAENPPKKYQDIYPVNFETEDWQNLWMALREVIFTWAEWGVRIIRVDNPHTKSFGFWEWIIAETRTQYPDMLFLSEAFTMPKVMQQLAKLGFSQSYTYYTWRNTKAELTEYMTELTRSDMCYYFRPNFWPNTHDINPYILQSGYESLFLSRFMMAATLSSNYGVFGPAYEFLLYEANTPKEEYKDSEKYEIKHWDWGHRNKLTYIYSQINRIRRGNTALQHTNNIDFVEVDNDQLLAYLKTHFNGNRILCVVNLDGYNAQSGKITIPLDKIWKTEYDPYRVRDLITGEQYIWRGRENYVEIDPYILPFHIFRIEDIHG